MNSTGSITSNVFCIGMMTERVAICSGSSRRRSFPLRGPLPFSGANAAFGYLPLQLALRYEVRKGEDSSGERAVFWTTDGEKYNSPGEWLFFRTKYAKMKDSDEVTVLSFLSRKSPSTLRMPGGALKQAWCGRCGHFGRTVRTYIAYKAL